MPHTGPQSSHHQTHRRSEIREKLRTWQGAKPVCLPKNRVPLDKPRRTTPPIPPRPAQITMEKPTLPCTKVEIPTNDVNDMGIQPFHQSDASKIQQDIAGKKINITAPDPGKFSQGKDSNTKYHKDRPLIDGKIINAKVCQ